MAQILVIDDDLAQRELLQVFLATGRHTVTGYRTTAEGVAAVAKHPPDLVILDVVLPDASWIAALAALRTVAPVLIVSGMADSVTKQLALHAGADDYITKPWDGGELLARIEAALRRKTPHPWGPPTTPSDKT